MEYILIPILLRKAADSYQEYPVEFLVIKFYFYFDGMTNEKHIDVYSFDEISEYNKKVDYNIIKKTLDLKGEITFTYLGATENNSINGYV